MAMDKKKNKPNSKKKVKARQEARKAFVAGKPGMDSKEARKRFFVQTRMSEAAKKGKKLDRKALREKFVSGDVKRKGFGAPRKKNKKSEDKSKGDTVREKYNPRGEY